MEGPDVRLRADPTHPFTQGYSCAKIQRYPARRRHAGRITQPMLREGSGFRAASWDEALGRAADSLEAALEDPRTVLLLRGSGSLGQSKRYLDHLFAGLAARDVRGSLCDEAGLAAVRADAGAVAMNHPEEIEGAEGIVLWGKHPDAGSIHLARQIARVRRRGVPVIGVNPDVGAVRDLCDEVVVPRPGSDRFLALAVAKLLLEARPDVAALAGTRNPEAYRELLAGHGLDDLLAACDVTREQAERLAGRYAAGPRVATVCGWALQRYDHGGETVRAIHSLCFLAGTLAVAGGGFYYGVSSSRFFRPPAELPPAVEPGAAPGRPSARPSGSGGLVAGAATEPLRLPLIGADLAAADPPIRFAYVAAGNLLNQAPDAGAVRDAFDAVPERVVVEPFWTETARHATIVLPPAVWLEEEDLVGSYWFPVVGAARRLVDPPADCRTDFDIARALQARIGLPSPYADVDEWLRAVLPAEAPSLEEIRRRGWWVPEEPAVAWETGYAHPDGRFHLLERLSPQPQPGERAGTSGGSLRLLSLIRREALHSQMLPDEQRGPLPARLHPSAAARYGLREGHRARLTAGSASLEVVVALDPGLHPEAVACPRDGWIELGLGPNILTKARATDLGETAAYYETRVSVAPAATGV